MLFLIPSFYPEQPLREHRAHTYYPAGKKCEPYNSHGNGKPYCELKQDRITGRHVRLEKMQVGQKKIMQEIYVERPAPDQSYPFAESCVTVKYVSYAVKKLDYEYQSQKSERICYHCEAVGAWKQAGRLEKKS